MANIGLGQVRRNGYVEQPAITLSDKISRVPARSAVDAQRAGPRDRPSTGCSEGSAGANWSARFAASMG